MAKPKFDPSKPFDAAPDASAKPKFDPSQAFQAAPDVARAVQEPSKLEALARGGLQGATLGFGDELSGATKAGSTSIGDWAYEKLHPDEPKTSSFGERYTKTRDEERAANDAAKKAHGGYYLGGQIGGGALTALVPGLGAGNIAKAGTLGGKMLASSELAGRVGALTGAGESTKSDLMGMLEDAARTGTISAAAGAAFPYLGSKLTPEAMKSAAESQAVKALNINKSDWKRLADNPGGMKQAGRDLLDSGSLGWFTDKTKLADNVSKAKSAAGQEIGDLLKKGDAAGGKISLPNFADNVRKGVVAPLQEGLSKESDAAADAVKYALDKALKRYGADTIPMTAAHDIESQLGQIAYNQGTGLAKNSAGAKALGGLRKEMSGGLDEGMGSLGFGDAWNTANRKYGSFSDLSKIAESKAGDEQVSRLLGKVVPLGRAGLASSLGFKVAGPVGAAAGLALDAVQQKYGNQWAAKGLDAAASGLGRLGETVAGKATGAIAGGASREAAAIAGDNYQRMFPRLSSAMANPDAPATAAPSGGPNQELMDKVSPAFTEALKNGGISNPKDEALFHGMLGDTGAFSDPLIAEAYKNTDPDRRMEFVNEMLKRSPQERRRAIMEADY